MRKIILFLLIGSITALVPVFMLSCGSGSGGSGGGFASESSSPGSVALYVTDTPADDYKQVKATINGVQLVHIGTGASCDVLTTPVTVDITDLASIIQLLEVQTCPSINFNRIKIEFDKRVVLTDLNNTTADCNFTSYKEGNGNPNILLCTGNDCSVNISGAVNVIANQNSELALDFDLKDFEVSGFDQPPFCEVTMKVSPLNVSDIGQKRDEGFNEGISGFISDLDTVENSFTLTAESGTLP